MQLAYDAIEDVYDDTTKDQEHDRTGKDAKRRLADPYHRIYTAPYQHGRHSDSNEEKEEIAIQVFALGIMVKSVDQKGLLVDSQLSVV